MSQLLHVFFDQDMRARHEGLMARAKSEPGFKKIRLGEGDILAFVNKARDRVMVLAGTGEEKSFGILGYYRSPKGRIDEMAIQFIPHAFGAGRFRMTDAIKEALLERLRKRARKNAKAA